MRDILLECFVIFILHSSSNFEFFVIIFVYNSNLNCNNYYIDVTHVPVPKLIDQLMCKNPAMKVFTKETVPKRYHYFNNKRIGDILLDLQDRWLVSE